MLSKDETVQFATALHSNNSLEFCNNYRGRKRLRRNPILRIEQFQLSVRRNLVPKYIYVICRPGGPYWEKLCQRPRAVPKTEGTVFPNTDRPRPQITCLLFSSVEYFVSSSCDEFSLQPFSNLVYACV